MKKLYLLAIACIFAMLLPITASGDTWNKYLIGLDPGHGGSDPGASGPSAPHEAELCLRAATEAKNIIVNTCGGRVNMTRTTNVSVSLSYRKSLSVSWDPYIFCAFHLNAFNTTAKGTETWYYHTTGNSYLLAQKVQSQLMSHFSQVSGYSPTNRGIKRNGWTVITGSPNVPAVLTEGLFVDNATEWNLINNNSKQGFKMWVMGHVMGFYDRLKLLNSSITNPEASSTPSVPDPTMTVSPTSIVFPDTEIRTNNQSTWDVEVKAANLTSDISYSLNNWNNFSVTQKSWNARTGGILTVSMHGYKNNYAGPNSGVLSITGAGKTVNVNLSGNTVWPAMILAQKGVLSDKAGNATSKGYDICSVRNMAHKEGKLYLVYEHKNIKVINSRTFDDLGNLNIGGVSGGTLTFCDIYNCAGKIVACNLATTETAPLKLYVWDNDQSNPRVLASITDLGGAARLGDCMTFSGNWTSGKFMFANDNGSVTRIIEYAVNNGVVNTTPTVKNVTTDGSTYLATQTSTRVWADGSNYFVDGKNNHLTHTDANGKRDFYVETDETWGNQLERFSFNGVSYALVNTYNVMQGESWSAQTAEQKLTNYTGGRMMLLNVTGDTGWSKPTTVGEFPSEGLSDSRQNTNCTGSICTNVSDGNYVEAWHLTTNQGLVYCNYVADGKSLPTYTVEPIKPVGPSLTASASTVTMSGIAYSTSTGSVKISGSNLEGDITLALSGANADQFEISPTTIAQATGSADITITYKPTAEGTHTATLTASSTNAASVNVTITGTAKPKTFLDDNITLSQVYNFSGNGTQPSWLDLSTNYLRSIIDLNGNIYALQCKAWGSPNIQILEAYTGNNKGTLSVEGVQGCTVQMSSLNKLGDKLIASSAASTTQNLYVYIWDNDASAPRILLQVDAAGHGSEQIGAQVNVSGDLNNGALWFANDNGTKIYKYAVTNGVASTTATVIELKKADGTTAFAAGGARGSIGIYVNADGTFWVTGTDYTPTLFNAAGVAQYSMQTGAMGGNKYGTAFFPFDFGAKKYALVTSYKGGSDASLTLGGFALVYITDGADKADAAVGFYPEGGLGANSNDQKVTCVRTSQRNGGKIVDVWVCVCKQGLAYYTYNGEKESGISTLDYSGDLKAYALGGTLYISGADVDEVMVYNTTGALVAVANTTQVNIDKLVKGIYVVRVKDVNGNVFSKSFIKK